MKNIVFQMYCKYMLKGLKVVYEYTSSWEPILDVLIVTCQMGSLSVAYYPTHVNASPPPLIPAKQTGTRFTYPGGIEG